MEAIQASTTETEDPYLTAFGLAENPFRLAPNAQYIYRTQATEEALRHGMRVIQGRLGLGAISGEIGLGKTTIARLFTNQASESDAVAMLYRIPGGSRQTEAQILLEITRDLGLETKDRSTAERSLKRIEDLAYEQQKVGKTVVVIIDDAHLLRANGIATILALLGLTSENHSLVQVMLFGQAPELMTVVMSDRALHSRLAMRTDLTRLKPQETQHMIEHRLASAGRTKPLFVDQAFMELHWHSNGVPRIACAIANRAATFAYEEGNDKILAPHVIIAAQRLEHHERASQ